MLLQLSLGQPAERETIRWWQIMNVKNYHIVMKEVTFVIMQSQAPMHSSILVTNPFTYIMEYIYIHTRTHSHVTITSTWISKVGLYWIHTKNGNMIIEKFQKFIQKKRERKRSGAQQNRPCIPKIIGNNSKCVFCIIN